jgi:hypothetical protein
MDLQREVTTAGAGTEDHLEAAFIDVARTYGERKGLTYDAWRSVGVEPRVLKVESGIIHHGRTTHGWRAPVHPWADDGPPVAALASVRGPVEPMAR